MVDEEQQEVLDVEVLPSADPIIRSGSHRQLAKPTKQEEERQQEDILKGLQDRIYRGALQVGVDMLEFNHIDPTIDPERDPKYIYWVKEYGEEEAKRKYRVASAGWLPSKEAPVAIAEATKIAVGIIKARASEKSGSRIINVGKLMMVGEIPALPERDDE